MYIELSNILLFILGVFYLIMLPGYLILAGCKLKDLDVIETLTVSFGIGIGVVTGVSIALSLTASIGLTASSLVLTNGAIIVILCFVLYKRSKADTKQDTT
ncbi:MAG TPA: hypothetical protein VEB88_02120 [Candidatus Acidoferrales bacterium]|nr:hypothetical protein [Candidatus Acidoferrales bacterium]